MAITTGFRNAIRQLAAEAIAPSGADIKIALIKVGASTTFDPAYASAYSTGLGGDECTTANGYTQGGVSLANRSAGVISGSYGWVDYDNAVWTAVGTLSAIGAVIYDATNSNRIIGFIDFGGTVSATDAAFTVTIPGTGSGLVRV